MSSPSPTPTQTVGVEQSPSPTLTPEGTVTELPSSSDGISSSPTQAPDNYVDSGSSNPIITNSPVPTEADELDDEEEEEDEEQKTLTIKSKSLKSVGKNAFKDINKNCTIKVPKPRLKYYKNLLVKKGMKKSVKIKGV